MTYILLIFVERGISKIIGKLGIVRFARGYYAYVGSAKLNFKNRVERHFSKEKKLFWHIDYLLNSEVAEIRKVFYLNDAFEHETAREMSRFGFEVVKGFGSSDCNCLGHLFYVDGVRKFEKLIKEIGFRRYI